MRKVAFTLLILTIGIVQAEKKWLDPDNPEDAVKIMRKVQSSLVDGETTFFWFYGTVYSHMRGEKDRKLFTYQGMNVRATKTVTNEENGYGFGWVSREVLLYTDPNTGELLRTWHNPWTGEDVEVIHIANDPVNSHFPIYAYGSRGPYKLPAEIRDGHFLMSVEIPLFYPNPLGGEYQQHVGGKYQAIEMFNWYARTDDLFDATKTSTTDITIGWARNAQWLPWMRMGDRPGGTLYHGTGKRVVSFVDLPHVLRETIEEYYPKWKAPPPLDDNRPNETSWIYFRKIMSGETENPLKMK